MKIAYRMLENEKIYDSYQFCVGSLAYRKDILQSYLTNYSNGMSNFLDLGCGTASTIELLPKKMPYIGIDISTKYLEKAVSRRPDIQLLNADLGKRDCFDSLSFNGRTMCIALGIYHHLDDFQLGNLLDSCRNNLSHGSKIFSMDPVISKDTSMPARWFAKNDRGKFVRHPNDTVRLFKEKGFEVNFQIKKNQMRIPLDTVEMIATLI